MTKGINTFIYPVTDLAKAKTLYSALLGAEPSVDSAYYVGFDVGGQHVGLAPRGRGSGMTMPVGYWQVGDIKGSVKTLLDAGAEMQQEVKDVGGGRLVATLKDADGNVIGLMRSA